MESGDDTGAWDRETLPAFHRVQDTPTELDSVKPDAASATGEPEENLEVDLQMELDCMQILEAPLDPSHGLHGVLRYRRESQERRVSPQPQPPSDQSSWCEFCGMTARPPLDSVQGEEPKDFCCVQYRELFEEVAQESRFVLKLCEERPSGVIHDFSSSVEEGRELDAGEWASEERRLQQRAMERFYKEAQARLSSETSSFHTQTISFRLSSCAPVEESVAVKKDSSKEEQPELWGWNNSSGPGTSGFGLNHHQDDAGFIQKFYSNGNKFLTGLPDGSAQVFYSSGNLAIILLSSEERVCIIYDDIPPHCPIRASFQSSGRATCYHGNGKVWLNMDMWGGQTLDEGGARTRKWSWSDHAETPSPLRPIFLSLNKHVGVRVLGRRFVFVTFLALGQQARFSVGSCTKPEDYETPPPGPPLCEEELIVLACQLYLRLSLTRLRWCHRFPSSPRHRNIKPPPDLLSLARRILSLSHSMTMKDTDRTFIQRCLQDCQ